MEYECPNCGEWIEFFHCQMVADCPNCEHTITLDPDGEFIEGVWHSRIRVIDDTARHERQMKEIGRRVMPK